MIKRLLFLLTFPLTLGAWVEVPSYFEKVRELEYYEGGDEGEHVEELALNLKTKFLMAACYRDAAAYKADDPYLSTNRICSDADWERIVGWLTDAKMDGWQPSYDDANVRGGTVWRVTLKDEDGEEIRSFCGANAFPDGFGDFYQLKRLAMKLRDPASCFPMQYYQRIRRNYISDDGQLIVYGPDFQRKKIIGDRRFYPVILLRMRYFEVGRPEVVWCEIVERGRRGNCTLRSEDGSVELSDHSFGYTGEPGEVPISLTLSKGVQRGVIHLNAVSANR